MDIGRVIEQFNSNAISILNQLPGYLVLKDTNSKFILTSKKTTNLFGFNDIDEMIGLDDYGLKCDAANCAEDFQRQDKIALTTENNKLDILGYYRYADTWRVTLNNKCVLVDSDMNIMGVSCYITDVTNYDLLDLSYLLVKTDRKYNYEISRNQCSYIINDTYLDCQLPQRQAQCLFFLLRGKSIKTIAKILNLSPRSVESYIDSLKNKFGLTNKSELIEYALSKGYINILPRSLLGNNLAGQLK